jgi:hypothetical protein
MLSSSQLELKVLSKEYHAGGYRPLAFDFRRAAKALTEESNSGRLIFSNHVHKYPGRLLPHIPLALLGAHEWADLKGTVLDPFAGTGTVLLASVLHPTNPRNAAGIELNPVGRLITRVRLSPPDFTSFEETLHRLHKSYTTADYHSGKVREWDYLKFWFSFHAREKLAKLRVSIGQTETDNETKDFLWLCFSSIIRGCSMADPYIPPPVKINVENFEKSSWKYANLKEILEDNENPKVWSMFEAKARALRPSLESIHKAIDIAKTNGAVVSRDASSMKEGLVQRAGEFEPTNRSLPEKSVDLIVTSPPYLTAQKYFRTTKLELLWLGHTLEEVQSLDKECIGSERVSVEIESPEIGVHSIDSLVKKVKPKSKVRAAMVQKYFSRMQEAVNEMHRVLKNDGYAVLVLGHNKVVGKRIDTYRLVTDLALRVGFKEVVTLRDKIRSRSMMTTRNKTGGLVRDEYVVILQKVHS